MNRLTYISIAFISLLFTACSNEMDIIIPSGELESVNLSINLDRGVNTKAQTYAIPDGYYQRYILEIWQQSGNTWICNPETRRFVKIADKEASAPVDFNITLPKGASYKLAVWVDYIKDNRDTDHYYITKSWDNGTYIGLSKVEMDQIKGAYTSDTELSQEVSPAQDAYTAFAEWNDMQKTASVKATRPFAQFNIFASDMEEWTGELAFAEDFTVDLCINNAGNAYNVLDNTVYRDNISRKQINKINISTPFYPYSDFSYRDKDNCFFSCLVFADSTPSTHLIWINRITSARDLKRLKNKEESIWVVTSPFASLDIDNVPLKRNYATNISGKLLYQDCTFTVTGSATFTNIYIPQVENEL